MRPSCPILQPPPQKKKKKKKDVLDPPQYTFLNIHQPMIYFVFVHCETYLRFDLIPMTPGHCIFVIET